MSTFIKKERNVIFYLEKYFHLKEHNSSVIREFVAGLATFMSMSYIMVVQPTIMKDTGMPAEIIVVATAIISAFATIAMGIYSKYPFALAPGMGENMIFAYTLLGVVGFTWQQGMSVILISGLLFLLLTIIGFREIIVATLPTPLKLGIGGVVGIYLIYLGLTNTGIIKVNPTQGFQLGDLSQPSILISIGGFFLILFLVLKKIPGAILIGILSITIASIPLGIVNIPTSLFSFPPSIAPVFFKYDFNNIFTPQTIPFILVFFIGDFFGTLGTLLGISSHAGYLDENGNLPNINKAFTVDALATIAGSMVGLSTVTTYVESAAGIAAGGRTGLSSVFTGLLFLLAVFFTPIILMIPSIATAPVFIIIGFMLLESLSHVNFGELDEMIAPFSMIVFTVFTLNMTTGIALGVLLYIIIRILKGEYNKLPIGLYFLGGIFFYYILEQIK